jgi:hypothetical protein
MLGKNNLIPRRGWEITGKLYNELPNKIKKDPSQVKTSYNEVARQQND